MELLNLTNPKSFFASAWCLNKHLRGVQICWLEQLVFSGSCETQFCSSSAVYIWEKLFFWLKVSWCFPYVVKPEQCCTGGSCSECCVLSSQDRVKFFSCFLGQARNNVGTLHWVTCCLFLHRYGEWHKRPSK